MSKDIYTPQPLWEPPFIDTELARKVDDLKSFNDRDADFAAQLSALVLLKERSIAQDLAQLRFSYQVDIRPDADPSLSQNYRAARAIEEHHGNCISHAELVAGVAAKLQLSSLIVWSNSGSLGNHASNLLVGNVGVHEVDAYTQFNRVLDESKESKLRPLAVAARHVNSNGGYAYLAFNAGISEATDSDQAIYNPDKDNAKAYLEENLGNNISIIMDTEYGMNMLGALGDKVRYQQTKPELIKKYGDQIMSYIPPQIPDLKEPDLL